MRSLLSLFRYSRLLSPSLIISRLLSNLAAMCVCVRVCVCVCSSPIRWFGVSEPLTYGQVVAMMYLKISLSDWWTIFAARSASQAAPPTPDLYLATPIHSPYPYTRSPGALLYT